MKSGAIGEYMIVIGIFWLWIGSALWLKLYLGAPYGSPGTEDIPVGITDTPAERAPPRRDPPFRDPCDRLERRSPS